MFAQIKAFMDTAKVKIGLYIALIGAAFLVIGKALRLWDEYEREKSDERSDKLGNEINQRKGELNELNKNSDSKLDAYKRAKRKYDESQGK